MERTSPMGVRRHLARWVGSAALVAAAAAAPALAQTSFNPSISVGASYTDDVDYVDGGEDRSDVGYGVGLTLPLRRTAPRGRMSLVYNADASWYDEADQFDDLNHRLAYDQSWSAGRGGTWTAEADWFLTSDRLLAPILPSGPDAVEDPVPTETLVTERVERETLAARVGRGFRLGPRWSLSTSLQGGSNRVDGGAQLEDSTYYGVGLGLDNTSSRRTRLGWDYSYSHSMPDVGPTEDVHRAEMILDWDVSRRMSLEFRGGAFARIPEEGGSQTGALGSVNVNFNQGLTAGPVRFGFGLGVSPSADDELIGNSLNTSASVSMSGVVTEPWNWRVRAGATHREPYDDTVTPEVDTTFFQAAVERSLGRSFGFRLTADSTDQDSEVPELDASFRRAWASLVYYPFASTRMARR